MTVPTRKGSVDKGRVLRIRAQGGRVCSKYKDEFYLLSTSAQESGPRGEGFVTRIKTNSFAKYMGPLS